MNSDVAPLFWILKNIVPELLNIFLTLLAR